MNGWLCIRRNVIGLAIASAFMCSVPAGANERLAGPVAADVIRVVDGDTIEVRAKIWLGQYIVVLVRLRGIDAPEIGGRAGCDAEAAKGAKALARMEELAVGAVQIGNVSHDKYARRVDAEVTNGDGLDLGATMLAEGLARPYDGRIPARWCDLAKANQ